MILHAKAILEFTFSGFAHFELVSSCGVAIGVGYRKQPGAISLFGDIFKLPFRLPSISLPCNPSSAPKESSLNFFFFSWSALLFHSIVAFREHWKVERIENTECTWT